MRRASRFLLLLYSSIPPLLLLFSSSRLPLLRLISSQGDAFLGAGTRTASWANLETPSDCAVPERFTFRFDRRLTAGELPSDAVAAVENLAAVKLAREHGLKV